MRYATIARTYAGALFELAERHGEAEAYAAAFRELDTALEDDRVRRFLETPKVGPESKQAAVRAALEGRVPERFLRFLLVVIQRQRQAALPEIRRQYEALLDERAGRINAQVTLARQPDEATVELITDRLTRLLGQQVVPHVHVNPDLIGGLVVRFGDRVIDGSLRRQLVSLRREMLHARLPGAAASA